MSKSTRDHKIGLSLGFIFISFAVFIAYQNPASKFEASIYSGTPVVFWYLLFAAIVLFSYVLLKYVQDKMALFGISYSILVILLLPILRNWYFIGKADSLKELGYIRDISKDTDILFNSLPTPGLVFSSIPIQITTSLSARRSMMISVIVFILVYIIFIGLLVNRAREPSYSLYVGTLSALLLLPINWQSIYILSHGASQALSYLPFVIFAFYLYLSRSYKSEKFYVILVPGFIFLLFVHPQITLDLLMITGGMILLRRIAPFDISDHKLHLEHVFILFISIFAAWSLTNYLLYNRLAEVLILISNQDVGLVSINRGSGSLSQKGLSLSTVFVRLFGVSLVFSLFAGLYIVWAVIDDGLELIDTNKQYAGVLDLFILSSPILLSIFGMNFLTENSPMFYFRHLSVIMLVVSIGGSLFLIDATRWLDRRLESSLRLVTIVLVVCLVLSIPVIYPSGFIGKGSQHVTESQMEAYGTSFEYMGNDVLYLDVYYHTWRFYVATYGSTRAWEGADGLRRLNNLTASDGKAISSSYRGDVSPHFDDRTIGEKYEESRYLIVNRADIVTETKTFNGSAFTKKDFEYLDTSRQIQRIYDNGQSRTYFI